MMQEGRSGGGGRKGKWGCLLTFLIATAIFSMFSATRVQRFAQRGSGEQAPSGVSPPPGLQPGEASAQREGR